MKKTLVTIIAAATIAASFNPVAAEGRNERRMHSCSNDINNPTLVRGVTVLTRASASLAFREFYPGSAPKVSIFKRNGVEGYIARSVGIDNRTGITELRRCFFKAASGKAK